MKIRSPFLLQSALAFGLRVERRAVSDTGELYTALWAAFDNDRWG